MIFDTHAHYHDARFDEDTTLPDRETLLTELFSQNIGAVVDIGTDMITSKEAIALSEKFPSLYAAVGMYPGSCPLNAAEDEIDAEIDRFRTLLSHPKVVAIGEIGLDFHYDDVPRDIQEIWFEKQLCLAEKTGYPILIHDREAHGATIALLRKHPCVRGVFHSYSGSAEMAREVISMGYMISFSGVITFRNATRMAELVKSVPLDKMLVETDCPYLTPVPFRGRTNHSGYIPYTLAKIAELHGISSDEAEKITFENARKTFRLP